MCRAVENQVTWVASNQTGPWGDLRFLGSAKVDPATDRAAMLLDVDHLADRRPHACLPHVTPGSMLEGATGG